MQQQTIDVSQPVPRVNAELMSSFIGKRVRLVGKVDSIDGPTTVNLRAADNGPVSASLALALPEEALNKVVELEGMVETVNTLSGASYVIFGDNFDLSNYNELCKLACKDYASMFNVTL